MGHVSLQLRRVNIEFFIIYTTVTTAMSSVYKLSCPRCNEVTGAFIRACRLHMGVISQMEKIKDELEGTKGELKETNQQNQHLLEQNQHMRQGNDRLRKQNAQLQRVSSDLKRELEETRAMGNVDTQKEKLIRVLLLGKRDINRLLAETTGSGSHQTLQTVPVHGGPIVRDGRDDLPSRYGINPPRPRRRERMGKGPVDGHRRRYRERSRERR